jgi:hypothetical protein
MLRCRDEQQEEPFTNVFRFASAELSSCLELGVPGRYAALRPIDGLLNRIDDDPCLSAGREPSDYAFYRFAVGDGTAVSKRQEPSGRAWWQRQRVRVSGQVQG